MAKNILHMITPLAHMSPFDVNMAIDAGYDATASYTNVSLGEITDLIQDAMFSRSPRDAVRTGVFIGGKDALLALDMLDAAAKALFKPFEISLFADPAGSFTTAAAMIAVVEKTLKEKKDRALRGSAVSVFGATGVVGTASAVIAALEGASVTLVARDGSDRTARHAAEINRRFGVNLAVADGSTPQSRAAILTGAEVVLAAAKAGVRVLDAAEIAGAAKLLIAADVNAVPPSGIEGVDAHANGTPLGERGALGIGALAIGNVKYRTESGLFKQMTESKTPCVSTSVRRSTSRARSRERLAGFRFKSLQAPRSTTPTGRTSAEPEARSRRISTPTSPSITSSLRILTRTLRTRACCNRTAATSSASVSTKSTWPRPTTSRMASRMTS